MMTLNATVKIESLKTVITLQDTKVLEPLQIILDVLEL